MLIINLKNNKKIKVIYGLFGIGNLFLYFFFLYITIIKNIFKFKNIFKKKKKNNYMEM